jgi:predicted unusual protein kinase regulating ubiquinone biosynthesis (AarF/ABC1/UbiB family)
MSDERKLPKSRLGRMARLARAGASSGLSMIRSKDASGAAAKVAGILGDLRGVATKVGQMASYVDGVVPEEHREAYERHMAKLRSAAPQSSPTEIRRIVEEDIGRPREEVFEDWQEEPIASASIGQVHRARMHDGREVAVKVQHAGIHEAMEADLRNAGILGPTVRMLGLGRFEVGRLVEEARQRFREELDYELEAQRQRMFADVHAPYDRLWIPAVIDEASGPRILTTEFAGGLGFEEATEADPELRRQWAEALWHFVYGSILYAGLFNADPHPGNYRFFDDGRVGFLDFGCVQVISPDHHRAIVTAHEAVGQGDFETFEAAMAPVLHAKPGPHREEMARYMNYSVKPLLDSPFRITREFAAEVVRRFKTMAVAMTKIRADQYAAMPEGILFLNRLQFGFYSVLARLDVEVDYAAVEHELLPRARAALSS